MECPNCGNAYNTGEEICINCGYRLPISTGFLSPGTILRGRYEITAEPSKTGGMGIVYFAVDKQAENKPCVVKQLKEPVTTDEVLNKLQEEAKRMAALSQAIGGRMAEILEDFVNDGRFCVVQQRIYGQTLEEIFYERRPLSEAEVVGWAIQCCRILQLIHQQKDEPVHRDISPDNLMLTNLGDIMMIDFGTLRELQHIVQGTAGMGKYGYTPREQWAGRPVPQSDIFALGATVFFLLTGFRAISEELTTNGNPQPSDFSPSYPAIRTINKDVSLGLERVLSRALEEDVNRRYPSAENMRTDMESLIKSPGKTVTAAAPVVYCPKCGKPNDTDNVYCQSCLAVLYPGTRQCSKGHANPINAKFCRKCGESIPTS